MRRGAVLAAVLVGAIVAAGWGGRELASEQTAKGPSARQAQQRVRLRVVPLAARFSSPVHETAPRSERNRLYVVEQGGTIRVLVNGRLRAEPFLDIRRLVLSGGEQGLLSVAFHPNYARNRRFYVYYTDRGSDIRVAEYRSDGARAIPDSARTLFVIDHPFSNHNGGQLAFGPDGRLYAGTGDGGSGGDPGNRAQNLASLLGKLLRIDVNRPNERPQIVAYGLRNPWRFSFDRRTGDLYIGDVGQSRWEEVDFTPRNSPGLENYGWDVYEGRSIYENKRPNPAGRLVWPIAVYNLGGRCSVVGGFVYRGQRSPRLRGRYFYGDYCTGEVWSLRVVRGRARTLRRERFRVPSLSSLGEDARGELYLASLNGRIYRLAA